MRESNHLVSDVASSYTSNTIHSGLSLSSHFPPLAEYLIFALSAEYTILFLIESFGLDEVEYA